MSEELGDLLQLLVEASEVAIPLDRLEVRVLVDHAQLLEVSRRQHRLWELPREEENNNAFDIEYVSKSRP